MQRVSLAALLACVLDLLARLCALAQRALTELPCFAAATLDVRSSQAAANPLSNPNTPNSADGTAFGSVDVTSGENKRTFWCKVRLPVAAILVTLSAQSLGPGNVVNPVTVTSNSADFQVFTPA